MKLSYIVSIIIFVCFVITLSIIFSNQETPKLKPPSPPTTFPNPFKKELTALLEDQQKKDKNDFSIVSPIEILLPLTNKIKEIENLIVSKSSINFQEDINKEKINDLIEKIQNLISFYEKTIISTKKTSKSIDETFFLIRENFEENEDLNSINFLNQNVLNLISNYEDNIILLINKINDDITNLENADFSDTSKVIELIKILIIDAKALSEAYEKNTAIIKLSFKHIVSSINNLINKTDTNDTKYQQQINTILDRLKDYDSTNESLQTQINNLLEKLKNYDSSLLSISSSLTDITENMKKYVLKTDFDAGMDTKVNVTDINKNKITLKSNKTDVEWSIYANDEDNLCINKNGPDEKEVCIDQEKNLMV
jgi:hypothetical protein